MRVRILVEAVRHKKLYLSEAYLERGHVGIGSKNLSKAFAFYSDEYFLPDKLDEHDIENIYKKENMKIRKNQKLYRNLADFRPCKCASKICVFCLSETRKQKC